MSQSDIQSYLQQVAGTHTLGQSNLPSNVNNGNPNTIYNYKPPQGGYLPPVTNAYDQWRINPAPVQQNSVNWQQLAMQGGGSGFNFNLGGILPQTTTNPPTSGGGTLPPPGGSTTPPTTFPPSTGGPLPPSTGTPGTHTPGTNIGSRTGGGGTYGNGPGRGIDLLDLPPGSMSAYFTDKPTNTNTQISTSAADPAGWGGMNVSDINSVLGTELNLGSAGTGLYGTPLGQALGIKSDGSISVGQLIDLFVPGNVYMGQTGKLNLLNAIPALAYRINPILGVAIQSGMTWLANHTNIQFLKNWLQRNQENKAAGRNGGDSHGQQGGSNWEVNLGHEWGGVPMTDLGHVFGGTVTIGGTGPNDIGGAPGMGAVSSGAGNLNNLQWPNMEPDQK